MRLQYYLTEEKNDKERWIDYLKSNEMLRVGVSILKDIEKAGFHSLIVGGSVRDIILGHTLHDVDIATNAPVDELERIFGKVIDIGKSRDFGVVTVKRNGHSYEIAQYRQDGSYTDGRRPDSVKICQSFEGDASRRDFCFNAMGVDSEGNIIDHFGGQKDIKNKILKTVGNPSDRFKEDSLRMLRATRFASKLGFSIHPDTKDAIKQNKELVKGLSPERVQQELYKMASLGGQKFADAIETLDEVGILEIILPEIKSLQGFIHNQKWHPESPTVYGHIITALRTSKSLDPVVNLSVLFHDLGKNYPSAWKTDDGDAYHQFYGHAEKGAKLVDTIADRLKLSNTDRDRIMFAVVNHMKVHEFPKMGNTKILKLIRHEHWATLATVSLCDKSCRGKAFRDKEWNEVLSRIEEVESKWGKEDAIKLAKLVNGKRVMELLGIPPSKLVGTILVAVTEYIVNNNIKDNKEIDAIIKKIGEEIMV